MNQVEIHRIPNKWGKQAAWDSLQVSFAFQSDRQNGDNNWNNKNRIPKDWSLREVGVTGIILNLFHELVFHGRAELTLLNFVFLSAIFTEQGFRWKELHGSLSDNVATNDARAVGEGSCNIGKHKDDQAEDKQSRHVDVCKVGGEVVMEWNILNTDESSTCSLSQKFDQSNLESSVEIWNRVVRHSQLRQIHFELRYWSIHTDFPWRIISEEHSWFPKRVLCPIASIREVQ